MHVLDRPHFTVGEASQVALKTYGLLTDAKQLPSERDQNFLLLRAGKPSWVLKIANKNEDRQVLAMQNEALELIEQRDPHLRVPRILPALDGVEVATIVDRDGNDYLVRLFSYLPGKPLAEARPYSRGLLADIGAFLGRLDIALLDFSHPAAGRPLTWHVSQADQIIAENLSFLSDPDQRSLVANHLEHFIQSTKPGLPKLRQAIIHNDANDYNILVHDLQDHKQAVAGLLDFGDMVRAPLVYEVAVAAAYIIQRVADPLNSMADLVAGYHKQLPLSRREAECLIDLMTIRLCTTVVLAARHRSLAPDQAYLSISEDGAWSALNWLEEVGHARAGDAILKVCGYRPAAQSSRELQANLLERRQKIIGSALSLSYRQPLHIVRGFKQYLFSESGRAYLDCVNNVAHVGHCHPRVVEAGQEQMALLNTNTRYLHENLTHYAERLCRRLPGPLTVCYFVCSGSEANELAIRLARAYTGRHDMIVIDGAYHGNTSTLIEHSPYKHDGPGGKGTPAPVHKVPMPDLYRGQFNGPEAGRRYAETIKQALDDAEWSGEEIAGLICEPLLGCGGQIVPPDGYLPLAFDYVRQAGGVWWGLGE